MPFVVRFLGSLVLATVLVVTMLSIGLKLYGRDGDDGPRRSYQWIELLSELDQQRLKELLGEADRSLPQAPRRGEIPPLPRPARSISGFVQLEVEVAPDGSVQQANVLEAVPGGYYEQEARSLMERRRFPATGEPQRRIEIVEFEIPARE